jgi:hypothetical protein
MSLWTRIGPCPLCMGQTFILIGCGQSSRSDSQVKRKLDLRIAYKGGAVRAAHIGSIKNITTSHTECEMMPGQREPKRL